MLMIILITALAVAIFIIALVALVAIIVAIAIMGKNSSRYGFLNLLMLKLHILIGC